MLVWEEIDTVLLDMDGTLLDLHFDNHFWQEVIPAKYAKKHHISLEHARSFMDQQYDKVAGTLDWYCLDYWQRTLEIDIMEAKREVEHLIQLREDTLPFLDALHDSGRQVVLVTNAHPNSLALKVEHTKLDEHIDELISTHEFGASKETQILWHQLQKRVSFVPERTLFVDDSPRILASARRFGIGHLLAVTNPDSQQQEQRADGFTGTNSFLPLLEDIRAVPASHPASRRFTNV